MDSKFATLELQSSVTYDAANPNAIDKTAPLPFLDWVKYFANVSSDPTFLLKQYKNYVNAWFALHRAEIDGKEDIIRELYVSLFRNIAVNYLTQEEKRFVQNADLTKVSEITAIMPLLVRKIKDICLYFASQRETIKQSTYNYNLKGSIFSIDKIVSDVLIQSFLNPNINKMFADAGVGVDDIKNNLTIELEPLYDLETNYFDINPVLPASAYDATGDRATYFSANSYDLDPDLFIDFDNSIIKAIQQYPVILQELGSNFSVNLDFTGQDLQYLKDEDYTTLVNDLDVNNLRLQTLKDALQHFSGTTFYYLSTNPTAQFQYGKLFEADAFSNYLNRRFPTVASVESNKLASITDIGGFFKPDKLGILNYLSFDLNGSITGLSANSIYVFPDPSIYGNISGLSRTKLATPFTFSEDSSILKNNNTTSYAFGHALSNFLTKFRGYQSRSESLNYDAVGVSRIQDSVEFFKGSNKTQWANADVFPSTPDNFLPIEERKRTLLNDIPTKTLVQHKVDIFNNEFAFYKEIYIAPNPTSIKNIEKGNLLTCLTLGGYSFYDSISGYNFNYNVVDPANNQSGVTTYTNGLTSLSAYDYMLQCILLYPEMDFYKTKVVYNINLLDGLNLGNYPTDSVVDTLSGSTFNYEGLTPLSSYSYIHSASTLDSGIFQFNNNDASLIEYDRSLIENNLVLGQTLSASDTTLYSISGNLTKDVTIYNQQSIYGDLYFRNYNDTIITAASAALSGLFTKYDTSIQNQLFNNLKSFDLVLDTAIFETDNYLVFERLSYSYDVENYLPQASNKFYIYKPTTAITNSVVTYWFDNILEYNQFSNTWYNETDSTILVSTTTLLSASAYSNARSVAVDLYVYDFESLKQLGTNHLCTFTLSSSPVNNVNLVSIEKPFLNYNSDTGNYVIKFLAKDPSDLFYDVTTFFKLDKEYIPYNVNLYTNYSDMFIFSENFGSQTFSSYIGIKPLIGTNSYTGLSGNSLVIN